MPTLMAGTKKVDAQNSSWEEDYNCRVIIILTRRHFPTLALIMSIETQEVQLATLRRRFSSLKPRKRTVSETYTKIGRLSENCLRPTE